MQGTSAAGGRWYPKNHSVNIEAKKINKIRDSFGKLCEHLGLEDSSERDDLGDNGDLNDEQTINVMVIDPTRLGQSAKKT